MKAQIFLQILAIDAKVEEHLEVEPSLFLHRPSDILLQLAHPNLVWERPRGYTTYQRCCLGLDKG